jgi:K+-sensing histidine kinase KdpD
MSEQNAFNGRPSAAEPPAVGTAGPARSRWPGRDRLALLTAVTTPLALSAILIPFRASFPNTDAALALLLVVVAVAANGYRMAGLLAAVSAAVWFDFFLTMPYERFAINHRNDIETTVLLLAIGIAVTEIAVWGRRQHAAASRRAGYLDGLDTAAREVATGGSTARLIEQVAGQLTGLLSLRSCRFQYGAAGIGRPARLRRDGRVVTAGGRVCDVEHEGLPSGDTELLVEAGGLLQGRFLMAAAPRTRPTVEQRLLAVAFADQVGAALGSSHLTRRPP